MNYRLWTNGTTFVRLWDSGVMEVARRGNTWETWGPPEKLTEESIKQASADRRSREAESPDGEKPHTVVLRKP